jgi:hypothetical protein
VLNLDLGRNGYCYDYRAGKKGLPEILRICALVLLLINDFMTFSILDGMCYAHCLMVSVLFWVCEACST